MARWTNLALLVPALVPSINRIDDSESLQKLGIPPIVVKLAPLQVLAHLGVIVVTWRATRSAYEVQQ